MTTPCGQSTSANIRRAKRRFWLLSVPMKTSEDDVDDDRFGLGPIYPALSLSSSLSLPFSLYLSIHLSFRMLFESFVSLSGQPAARPLVLRSGRAIFICSVSSVVFLRTLELRQHAVLLCACYHYPLPSSSRYLSLCFTIPSDHLNTIFFCLFFPFFFLLLPLV